MKTSGKSNRKPKKRRLPRLGLPDAIWLVQTICRLAASPDLIGSSPETQSILERSDNAALFDWLMAQLSFQGISDRVAAGYLRDHGSIAWSDVVRGLQHSKLCPKLESYWALTGCGYQKSRKSCSRPDFYASCSLPRHPLRNGRLNITGYSLALFIRDVANGDLIGWIDGRLNISIRGSNRPVEAANGVVEALSGVFGVGPKVASMALASFLLNAGSAKPSWRAAGQRMIPVDVLLHNFLHRTGLTALLGTPHLYGLHCYAEDGCSDVIERVSAWINAREFNAQNPPYFPRLVAHALWKYCALDFLDVCNGVQIDDRKRCSNRYCAVFPSCARRRRPQ